MSRLIVKNLPNGVSKESRRHRPVAARVFVSSPQCVCLVCRWRRRGSSQCSPPSAQWQTALWSSPRTASSASSVLWALSPRKTRRELCSILTRASWTRPEWRWGSCCGLSAAVDTMVVPLSCEPSVVHSSRWRCVKTLETPQRPEPGVNTARPQQQRNPPPLLLLLLQTTAKRYKRSFKLSY